MKFYDAHADQRDRFEVLAFHDDRAKTIAEIDQKLRAAGTIEKRWGGRALPFPVLVDETGATTRRWGISAYPTTVLIDPEGRLVKDGSQEMLEAELAKLRDAAGSRATDPDPDG